MFKDDFSEFVGVTGNQAAGDWESDASDGGCLVPSLTEVAGVRCLRLSWDARLDRQRNGFIAHRFKGAARRKLTFSFGMLHSNGRMGQCAGLFNAERSRGYAVFWGAGDAPTNGMVQIVRFDGAAPVAWSTRGTPLATVRGGDVAHDSQKPPLAAFLLVIDPSTGAITLNIDGDRKTSLVDPAPIPDLQWVVLRGNAAGLFSDVSVMADK